MKIAFLFPGQGAQYPGMAKDFVTAYPVAKQTFEEADDLLGCRFSDLILKGPETALTETKNSQPGIYIASIAILRVLQNLFPNLIPDFCAGLSLGEYTAAAAAGSLNFSEGLLLVKKRGQYMNEACLTNKGTMAVILGLSAKDVRDLIKEIDLPNELWAANFNCPGQIVISGTVKGVEIGSRVAKEKGAKRVQMLKVHGAFHSGLMESARIKLAPFIEKAPFCLGRAKLVMNVDGGIAEDTAKIKNNLIAQVTSSVFWEKGVQQMNAEGVDLFIEIGPGKSLLGFNRRIGVLGNTISIENTNDLNPLEGAFKV